MPSRYRTLTLYEYVITKRGLSLSLSLPLSHLALFCRAAITPPLFCTGNLGRRRKVQIICTNTCKILPVTEFFHFLPELTSTESAAAETLANCPILFRFRLSFCRRRAPVTNVMQQLCSRRQPKFMINSC